MERFYKLKQAISDIQIIAQIKSEKCDMGLVDGASAWTTDK